MNRDLTIQHILLDSATRLIPQLFAVVMFAAGGLLLVSVLTPIDPKFMPYVVRWLPLGLVEFSHAIGTASGVLMLFVARGLWERIDTAWYMAMFLFCLAAVVSLTRELAVVPAVLLTICALLLIPCKDAFNRRSNLLSLSINPIWAGLSIATLGVIVWSGFYAYQHVPYAHSMWVHFSYRASASRFLRGLVVMAVTAGLILLYRLFGIARQLPPEPQEEDVERLKTVVAGASNPQAWLALLRDKHILWNDDQTAFIMYGVSGQQWVVMGEPIGPKAEAEALCWQLKELASLSNARLSFYQVSPNLLPLMIDLGLRPYKIGEEAMVDVAAFDLAGKKGYGFRQTIKRFEGLGAEFEVIAPEDVGPQLDRLKAVSDAWLKGKSAKEKSYSLGCFQDDYMRLTPVAVLRVGGEIVAFANLWPTQDRTLLSIDLMRYAPDAPPSTMEYLFLQLIFYTREHGYRYFSLGLAPLAGLRAKPLSSAWPKLASLIWELGGEFYNFEGLRAYKEKFKPDWEPRYFAVPGQEAALVPALMAVVALGGRTPKPMRVTPDDAPA
ncbi:phosphatidylglycerol lysyltransferase domain-containing protein [Asticcacaulis sp. EMRT-3]|uniref:phosphatidylglycerol lysyltransferase domain-containing protein n=1 Tax=Asticcacaulis sp. EMRT-3 TaxID=3040349 RepID=UPI0024AF1FA4|nr:phosphatidylglycerol lysyltransferase domain-containing protein [Asticcacaulis sp. EMRT-3]MDI7775031.1 phosphatidylglycerol lysyltransferase domain-containing protein [Asticcacaulis sp. EMRT-3]